MYWHSYFRNPAAVGADRMGSYIISALVVCGLVFLFNVHQMKKIRQGGFRTGRSKTLRQKAVLVMCGAFVGLLIIMLLGMYLGSA